LFGNVFDEYFELELPSLNVLILGFLQYFQKNSYMIKMVKLNIYVISYNTKCKCKLNYNLPILYWFYDNNDDKYLVTAQSYPFLFPVDDNL